MVKVVVRRPKDKNYGLIKSDVAGKRRPVSLFQEYASIGCGLNDTVVDDAEMTEIMAYAADLDIGLSDVKKGRYEIVG